MTKMYVDRFVRWLHGETNQSDMLGNTVQSAIDAVNKWMYDLDHPLIGAAPTRPEDRWLVDKEWQFYEPFLDKLLALLEESDKTSAKETVFAEKVSATKKRPAWRKYLKRTDWKPLQTVTPRYSEQGKNGIIALSKKNS